MRSKAAWPFVGDTGNALTVIVDEVKEIHRHINAIVGAAREQSIALQEINTCVNTLDQGTQLNAAMVEEPTAASDALVQEVSGIARMLSEFKIGKGIGVPRTAAAGVGNPSRKAPPRGGTRGKLAKAYTTRGNAAVAESYQSEEKFHARQPKQVASRGIPEAGGGAHRKRRPRQGIGGYVPGL